MDITKVTINAAVKGDCGILLDFDIKVNDNGTVILLSNDVEDLELDADIEDIDKLINVLECAKSRIICKENKGE